MTTCLIGLGGNLGNVPQTIVSALQSLSQLPGVRVERWSSLHQTNPVGASAGGTYINAAAILDTSLSARELLEHLMAVENEFGRERTISWRPRTLDLDLLFFGDEVIDESPALHVHIRVAGIGGSCSTRCANWCRPSCIRKNSRRSRNCATG